MRVHALLLLAAVAGCSDPAVPPAVERVEVTAPPLRADARADMLRERAGDKRVLSDARDAWTIPVGGEATIELGAYAAPDFASAAGLVVPPDGPRTGVVRLEFRVEGPASFTWKMELDLAAPDALWSTTRASVPAPSGFARVEFSARWVGAPPPGADKVRAAFELPRGARGIAAPRAGSPNVLIVTVDTLRSDRLGCYGYGRPTSPRIDQLAAGGTRFANAYSSAPWTLPSYGSLFTGLLPGEHRAGIVTERDALFGKDEDAPAKLSTEVLRADVATLAEQFAGAGFATAMFHNNPYLSRATGLERGFQRYVMYGSNARNGVDLALSWIEDQGTAPWFGVVHLMDPHFPYAPPAPFDEQFAGRGVETIPDWPPNLGELRAGRPSDEVAKLSSDLYDGEIAFTDQQIGRLLDGLEKSGLLANTIVVLHSDHGEEFWEHGSCDHGHAQNEELLRVPLVIVWPDHVPAGRVVETRVRALDLYPTLLGMAGIPGTNNLDAATLWPLFQGAGAPRLVLAEAVHSGKREIKAVLSGKFKLVARGATENHVYALDQDPGERTDRAVAETEQVEALRKALRDQHALALEAAKKARALVLDDATRAKIHGLGYGGEDAPTRDK
ncbi:MAG: sulfatase [Planctomycetota bacterium]|nr:sulfatase [Planctomycetota bacterium]